MNCKLIYFFFKKNYEKIFLFGWAIFCFNLNGFKQIIITLYQSITLVFTHHHSGIGLLFCERIDLPLAD